MKIDRIPPFGTDHLYLAAYLICAGYTFLGTSPNGLRVSFVFQQTPELSAAVASFMAGATIPARQFAFEVLKLKKLIPRSESILEKSDHGTEKSAP
jgi:hypothetical protein